jgi:capsular polysaccharide biosynthesis protein
MSSGPGTDLAVEREIDLSHWRTALLERWWIVVAGLVAGAVVGGVYSLSGGSLWEASVLLVPSQAFSPSGAAVLSYQSSPRAIDALAKQESMLEQVAKVSHVSVAELRNHVATSTVSTGASASTASRGSQLIKITVQVSRKIAAADAANALGRLIAAQSTGPYVMESIKVLNEDLQSAQTALAALTPQIDAFNKVLATQSLDPFDKLILETQLQNAIARQGNLNDKIETETQQLVLANQIEKARVISPAAAQKTTARSRRTSVVFGALIGLIIGVIAALVVDTRATRARRA